MSRYIVGLVRPTLKLNIGLELDMTMGLRGCLGVALVFDSHDAAQESLDNIGIEAAIIQVAEADRSITDETSDNARAYGV